MMTATREIQLLLGDLESDRVERTVSTTNTDKFGQAICAFANDLPGRRLPGYLLLGVKDDGAVQGITVTDELLKNVIYDFSYQTAVVVCERKSPLGDQLMADAIRNGYLSASGEVQIAIDGSGDKKSSGSGDEKSSGSGDEKSSGSGDEKSSGSGDEKSSGNGDKSSRNEDEKSSGNEDEKSSGNGDEKSSGNGDEKSSGNGDEKSSGNGDKKSSGKKTAGVLSPLAMEVYRSIQTNRNAKYAWIMEHIGVSKSSVYRAIGELKRLGYLHPDHPKAGGVWQIAKGGAPHKKKKNSQSNRTT